MDSLLVLFRSISYFRFQLHALTVHSCMMVVIYGDFLLVYPSSSTIYQRKQQSIQFCEAISWVRHYIASMDDICLYASETYFAILLQSAKLLYFCNVPISLSSILMTSIYLNNGMIKGEIKFFLTSNFREVNVHYHRVP